MSWSVATCGLEVGTGANGDVESSVDGDGGAIEDAAKFTAATSSALLAASFDAFKVD